MVYCTSVFGTSFNTKLGVKAGHPEAFGLMDSVIEQQGEELLLAKLKGKFPEKL